MHRVKVRVVEDALDANNTIAARQPRRLRPPRRRRRQPHERARRRQDDAARAGARPTARRRARRRARGRRAGLATTPTGSPALHVPVTQLNTDPGFGGECHLDANMVRSALPALPLARDRPARDRERRQPRLPGRVPRRRGRARDGRVGHRGRGQAAQVPAHVPHLRARAGQQDRPAAAPRRRPRALPAQPRRGASRTSSACSSARARARASRRGGRWLVAARGAARRGPAGVTAALAPAPELLARLRRAAGRRALFEAEADAHRARSATAWPSASRAAGGCSRSASLAGGALGRAPRRGRVRAPGDRRQARAARRSALARECAPLAAELALLAEPDDIVVAFGEPGDGPRSAGPRAGARARLPDGRVRAARRRVGARAADRRPVRRARSSSRRLPRALGARARVLRAPRPARGPHASSRVHDVGASSFLYPFLAEREHDLDAVLADVRDSVLHEGRRDRARCASRRWREGAERSRGRGRALRGVFDARRHAARARQRRLGDRRDGRRRRLRAPPPAAAGRRGARSTSPPTRRSSPRSRTTSAPRRSSRAR